MRTSRLPTVRVSVATSRYQYQYGGRYSEVEYIMGNVGDSNNGPMAVTFLFFDTGTFLYPSYKVLVLAKSAYQNQDKI